MSTVDNIREILGSPDESRSQIPNWKIVKSVGAVERFRGNQVLKVDIVGMGASPDQIQITTQDTWEGETRISRCLVMGHDQAPAVLQGLLDAEIRIADLEATDRDSWPEMPLVLAEAEAAKNTLKVMVDLYRDNLEMKITKNSGGGRTGQWAKWDANSCRPMMRLILQAYDAISETVNTVEPDQDPSQGEDLF